MRLEQNRELMELNDIIDELLDLEVSVKKATTIMSHLLQEYDSCDEEELAKHLSYNASGVMEFVNIAFDYIHSTYKGLGALSENLMQRKKSIREKAIENGLNG